MATSMANFSDNSAVGLDVSDYQCDVCFSLTDDFLLLPNCGHSYCHTCISRMVSDGSDQCPGCRSPLSQVLTDNNNAVTIGHKNQVFVFVRNLKLNAVVKNLAVKCDYAFNGCPKVTKLFELSVHLDYCQYKYCGTCGLTAGQPPEHNCVQELISALDQKARDRDYEEYMDDRGMATWHDDEDYDLPTIEDMALKLSVVGTQEDKLFRYTEEVMFGSYRTRITGIEVDNKGIWLKDLSPDNRVVYNLRIRFIDINEIRFREQRLESIIFIKVSATYCQDVIHKDFIRLGEFWSDQKTSVFDVDSEIKSKRYLMVKVFDQRSDALAKALKKWPKKENPLFKFKAISESKARSLRF